MSTLLISNQYLVYVIRFLLLYVIDPIFDPWKWCHKWHN